MSISIDTEERTQGVFDVDNVLLFIQFNGELVEPNPDWCEQV